MNIIKYLLCALIMSQSVSTYVWAQDVQSLTVSLVKKRAAVEELTDQVEREKRLRREQQRAFSAQKAQLESELQREDVRHAQLVEAKGRKTAVIDSAKQSDVALLPVFEKGAESLKAYINTSLPFRRSERLGEVKNLQDRLKNGLLTPRNALNRLWSLVEDERRMSKENGLFRNTLVIDGQSMMVDVIRIGTVGMYFRTGTGRVGVVTKAGKVWQSQFLDSESSRRQVSTLFDAFKKQIRVGFFDLPNLITSGEDS